MKRALYFGLLDVHGHFLHTPECRTTVRPGDVPGFPWDLRLLDTGLLNNRKVPDNPDGRVHWTCGGRESLWFAFFWWDRSGDRRPNSNSGFYVEGFGSYRLNEAFEFACERWPDVVARQEYPLVLRVAETDRR